MSTYKSIIKADYLERTRSYAFLITMLVSVCMAYTFVPAAGAKYATVRVGNFTGYNNAAWVGHITAIMASTFLWLLGFYLVSNGIKKDKESGVGQIIATTSISNFKYLLAKALSNFFVLLTITLIVMVMALTLALIRGSNYPFDVLQFLFPYIFSTIPSIFFVSVLAVVAEVIAGKYTILQNIGFFILFIIIVSNINAGVNPNFYLYDVLGTRFLTNGMTEIVNRNYSPVIERASAGFLFSDHGSKYFLFEGTHWTAIFIVSRILWIGLAFLLLFIASGLFRRFDVREKVAIRRKKKTAIIESNLPLKEIHLSALPVAEPAYGILPFIKIEFLMLLRKGPRWFWLINIGGCIALFFIPLDRAHQIGLPVLWFLQINRWADIATKERYNRIHYFTYAAYKPLQRLLASQIIAGVILAVAFAVPVIARYIINGDYITPISIVLGATFIIAFSVSSGILSGGKRIFEIAFFMLTYANINAAAVLDYFGAVNHGANYIALMFIIISIMFFVAFTRRKYEISHQ